MKVCSKCKSNKDSSAFHKDKRSKDGLYGYCIDCVKLKNKHKGPEQRKKHFRARRNYNLRTKFGLSSQEVDQIIERSLTGNCEICGKPEQHNTKKALSLDHNHKTNKIRGLLCHNCNLVLGHSLDDIAILTKAINYLIKYS